MTLHHAYLIKGYLIGQGAPAAVMEAIGAVIAGLPGAREAVPFDPSLPGTTAVADAPTGAVGDPSVDADTHDLGATAPPAGPVSQPAVDQPKKRKEWSPEARAAAAERMKARQAAGLMGKRPAGAAPSGSPTADTPKPFTPLTADKLLTDHDGYAGKRDPFQPLTDDDWPDIKARLAKSPDRRTIAGDYDVALDDLNFFVQSCQRREQRSGEALASPPRGASGAPRTTW